MASETADASLLERVHDQREFKQSLGQVIQHPLGIIAPSCRVKKHLMTDKGVTLGENFPV